LKKMKRSTTMNFYGQSTNTGQALTPKNTLKRNKGRSAQQEATSSTRSNTKSVRVKEASKVSCQTWNSLAQREANSFRKRNCFSPWAETTQTWAYRKLGNSISLLKVAANANTISYKLQK
jgi:hypothetical protein